MNVQEFSTLKVGDKIENHLGNDGEVSEVTPEGVRVKWDGGRSSVTFLYTVNSTSWFHWSKVDLQ